MATSYLTHTKTALAPAAILPLVADTAAVLTPQARIDLAAQAVSRVQSNLNTLLACDALIPPTGFSRAVYTYDTAAFITSIVTGSVAFIGLFGSFFVPRLLIPTVLAGGICAALSVRMNKNDKAIVEANNRTLDTKDLGPLLETLQQASREEHELLGPHIEQRTASLAADNRLTPKAAMALRRAIDSATPGSVEAQRAATLVAFVRDATDSKEPPALPPLVELLTAASPDERMAAAAYLERVLFPNERPLARFKPDFAHELYAIIDSASRGEVPQLAASEGSEA